MVRKGKLALLAGLALGALGSLTTAQIAAATHPRPKGATPVLVPLVVAYNQCTTATNRQHGPPLAALSCSASPSNQQTQQTSSFLTLPTGDAWPGAVPNSIGSVRFDVKVTSPEDVKVVASITDVRCVGNSAPGFCGTANTDNASLPDYTGELNGVVNIRVTDHYNGPIGGSGGTDPATVSDVPLSIAVTCTSTPVDTTRGSNCAVSTTANSVFPGAVQDAKRANLEAQAINVQDGGTDGTAMTTFDNTLFETQGVWVP
jgi:hypothetical protein